MPLEKLPLETLIVGSWSSKCNNCGRQTVNFKEHDEVSGYAPRDESRKKGCGIKFEYVTMEYGDDPEWRANNTPDLIPLRIEKVYGLIDLLPKGV